MSDTIIVTGVIDLDPAKRDDAIELFTWMMEVTRAEDGCEAYTFSADVSDPGRFHLSEQWASKDAVAAHGAAPHFIEFLGKMGAVGVTAFSATQWSGATPTKIA